MVTPTRSFDLGNVLSNTFGVISRHPLVFLGLSFLISGIPNALIELFTTSTVTITDSFASSTDFLMDTVWIILMGVVAGFVFVIVTVLLQAALIVATIKDLRGEHVDLGECFSAALNKFFPLLGVGILSAIGVMFGLVLLVVPGVIFYLMWVVAGPALMAENKGVIESMQRSAALTSGSKWMLFLLMVIFFMISGALTSIVAGAGYFSAAAGVISSLFINTIGGAIQGAGVAATYVELRAAKEGSDTGTLAEVFS